MGFSEQILGFISWVFRVYLDAFKALCLPEPPPPATQTQNHHSEHRLRPLTSRSKTQTYKYRESLTPSNFYFYFTQTEVFAFRRSRAVRSRHFGRVVSGARFGRAFRARVSGAISGARFGRDVRVARSILMSARAIWLRCAQEKHCAHG